MPSSPTRPPSRSPGRSRPSPRWPDGSAVPDAVVEDLEPVNWAERRAQQRYQAQALVVVA